MINNYSKFIFIFSSSIFLFSCSPKNNNFDIDLSNLPRPKSVKKTDIDKNKKLVNNDTKRFIKDLIPLKTTEEILSTIKSGKSDPFSETKFSFKEFKNLKLNGFLNTDSEEYVLVSYLGKEGAISKKSIGGVNTNLLPDGAKVKDIDLNKKKLIIDFKNKEYFFEL